VEEGQHFPAARKVCGGCTVVAGSESAQIKIEDVAFSSLSEGWGFVMFRADKGDQMIE
jgi:hypothetical protein